MSKELTPLEAFYDLLSPIGLKEEGAKRYYRIEKALKRLEQLEEENKFLRESNENLDENYFDTWSACERLKENSNYALMFIDDIYCLVDTKDNKFDVIDNYKINNYGIIDNGTQKKLKALEIIKEKTQYFIDFDESTKTIYIDCALDCDNQEYDLLKEVLL